MAEHRFARWISLGFTLACYATACGGGADEPAITPNEEAGVTDGAAALDAAADATGNDSAHGDASNADVLETDASPIDAAQTDASFDATVDATGDAGTDTSVDSSADAPLDVHDASIDSSQDAGHDASDGGCGAPDLLGSDRHVFVDLTAPAGGNGSIACPFRTILAATTAATAPPAGSQLTIHVRGTTNTAYAESTPVTLGARTKLTSAWDGSVADPARVTIHAQGSCGPIRCSVHLVDATLEGVTVTPPSGASGLNGIFATGGSTIENVTVTGMPGIGIETVATTTIGPGVHAIGNVSDGLRVSMATSAPGSAPSFRMLSGGRGNRFEFNGGHGVHVLDRYGAVHIAAARANGNARVGVYIESEAITSHTVENLEASRNGSAGLRIPRGPATVSNGAFDANGVHGAHFGNGTDINALFSIVSSRANGNGADGVRVDTADLVTIDEFVAQGNGVSPGGLGGGSGVFVAFGTSLRLRNATLLGNTVGVFFSQKRSPGGAALSTIDLGQATNDLGGNVFGAATTRNQKGGICILDSGPSASEIAVGNAWVTCPPTQSKIPSSPASNCYDATTYTDVLYKPHEASHGPPVQTGGASAPECTVGNP